MNKEPIILKKVRVHNLKDVSLELGTGELIVFTGVSGSGKSSLAFDTIYVEGQRRYIESLSSFARHYLGEMSKPSLEHVSGLSPTISIEQKMAGKNPRSTVATMTEIYDYLRVLFARIATPYCPVSGEKVMPQSKERIIQTIQTLKGSKILILSPYVRGKKGEFKDDFQDLSRKGYMRLRVDSNLIDLSEKISLDRKKSHDIDIVIDRLSIEKENFSRIAESVNSALQLGNGSLIILNLETNEEILFSTKAYSPKSGISYPSLEPHDFSFNSPHGMCSSCHGLGMTQEFDLEKIIDPEKSIAEDACVIASSYKTVRYGNIYQNLADLYKFSIDTPWKKLSEKARQVFLYGVEKKWIPMHFVHPQRPISWTEYVAWRGVLHEAKERYIHAKSDAYRKKMERFMHTSICLSCRGSRLKPYPSSAMLGGKRIHEITSMSIEEAEIFFSQLKLDKQDALIAQDLLQEIIRRLHFLNSVGLNYLSLDRSSPTLSGGESQRVRLASQVGGGLVGVTYVLDEPSIGLHPRDNLMLISTLKTLKERGNTVIVVEHDEETILESDRIVDFGPGAGSEGGNILYNGPVPGIFKVKNSLTGDYLSGRREIAIPQKRRKGGEQVISIKKASHNNLKKIDVDFPLGLFIAVTGVSGSGKSSLIADILYPALANYHHGAEHIVGSCDSIEGMDLIDKVIAIDQSPIGRNPRSNPATYIKIFDEIRKLFSELPEARARGYLPGRFSFNVQEGSCSECRGIGSIRIDMDFLEDIFVPCPTCKNQRFDSETLSIHYKGKNIHDVLEMTVDEALSFFESIPQIKQKLQILSLVGMGYITLGQSSQTLSGGEAQRVKLAKELSRPPSKSSLYILDEPTTGLHFHDVKALLNVLQELVDKGHTVLVIEHNMEVVKTADWVIDLGPEGGTRGGNLIAAGTPEKIARLKTPTGIALNSILNKKPHPPKEKKKIELKEIKEITVQGASQNNLKGIDISIPRGKITICTGPSGSGKSSLALDTIYAEGQRRYIESLSPYARQFVKQMQKPKFTSIEGLSPAISIEQKIQAGNPRSTVGTMTEIYDYLRILYAKKGIPHDPETGELIQSITKEVVIDHLANLEGEKIILLAPLDLSRGLKFQDLLTKYAGLGFLRVYLNGEIYEIEGEIPFDPKRKNEFAIVIDRFKAGKENRKRMGEAVEQALLISKDTILLLRENQKRELFNLAFATLSGKSYKAISPHTFSFNSPEGMCMDCQGLGFQYGANFTKMEELMSLPLFELFSLFFSTSIPTPLIQLLKKEKIDPSMTLLEQSPEKLGFILNGSSEWFQGKGYRFKWQGLQPVLAKAGRVAKSEIRESLIPILEEIKCFSCEGGRLNPLARHVLIDRTSIVDLCKMPLETALRFIQSIKLSKEDTKILSDVILQIKSRINFLLEVGLHYLSLDRKSSTLSNGESERIRLARQLGGRLTGVLYVLDEPTVGLHPKDNAKLAKTLHELKGLGNTLLLVEHDAATIKEADWIVDFGPGAGMQGGHKMAEGTYEEILKNPRSLTGAYLSGKKSIQIPKKRRKQGKYFEIESASIHNLKNLSLKIPIGLFTCLTGVSGSGKSTLLHEVIKPHIAGLLKKRDPFDKLIVIDQNPIGHTVRADVATYSDILTPLRSFFSNLAQAKVKGLQPRNFSYNHKKGMCTHCYGLGYKKVDLLFLPQVRVPCEMCRGHRLNPSSLEVRYQDKNLGELLDLSIVEIGLLFDFHTKIKRIADTLLSVGLGYLKLGQEIQSLSSGEAQRLKLARELSKRGTGKTLYLLDEPTSGQHPDDIQKLLILMHELVNKGNTLIVIEHSLDVIKNADYLFDLGPEGGQEGGYLVAEGTPEEVAKVERSYTGQYLKKVLSNP